MHNILKFIVELTVVTKNFDFGPSSFPSDGFSDQRHIKLNTSRRKIMFGWVGKQVETTIVFIQVKRAYVSMRLE